MVTGWWLKGQELALTELEADVNHVMLSNLQYTLKLLLRLIHRKQ